ncbi:Nif11-like leader peptide family RiPP precursor [Aquabacter sediminis]|uniref:Nif11-like leader peptide family RiPP precursor n=1 Tax=Aquabacter sediminis TaxID=3029197 RepID=UPI00237D77BE|nr:Nif11-like leader peptide family RiPP precursor [Aquabacter sp. P-9]MDE1570798.1 Nif11-like leader peptide family RiPP precursor [Aquabacter sp. P-9]
MSEKFTALLAAIDTDPDVATRFRDALPESTAPTPEQFLAAAHAAGFDLTAEDLPPASAPLGDAKLEGVAGGMDNLHNFMEWRRLWKH